MKNLMLAMLLFGYSGAAFSKVKNPFHLYYLDWEFSENSKPNEQIKSLGIKTLSVEETDRKGKTFRVIKHYDREGFLTKVERFNPAGKLQSTYEQRFNAQKKLVFSKKTVGNKITENVYNYAENGKILRHEIRENGKLIFYCDWTYDYKGFVQEKSSYNRKGLMARTTHEYDDSGKLLRTNHFNAKGKLTSAYNYACKDEGEKLNLAKQEKLQCSTEHRESGFIVRVTEHTMSNGEKSRMVFKFREKDTSLVEEIYFGYSGKINFRVSYDPDLKRQILLESTFIEDKPTFVHRYEYDQQGLLTKEITEHKGEILTSEAKEYSTEQLLIKSEIRNTKNQIVRQTKTLVTARY